MPAFEELHRKTNGQILKQARQGRLVNEAFKEFSRRVYPGASEEQIRMMRVCFFARAAELNVLLTFGADLNDGVSDADMEFWVNVVGEIERFHAKTIDTSEAGGTQQ